MAALNRMIANGALRAVYGAGQAARILWYTGHYAAGRRTMGPLTDPGEAPYAEEFAPLDRERLKNSFREAFRKDWENIAAGVYKMPLELKRPPSPVRLWQKSRDYLRDSTKVARRKASRGHSEVLAEPVRDKYPRYYLQNFHYQTDGWLSASSAERYDMQVETLFTGSAGVMRRAALPLIYDFLKGRDVTGVRLLDLGCGVGTFLREVKHNWPALDATAVDLSPAYLGKARTNLAKYKSISFVEANAECSGLPDQSFDLITSVYLFHELPPKARANVVAEMARVLRPGGVVIHVDTIQYGDEPGLDILLENFPRGFHEPYYDSYCRTDLADLYGDAGFAKQGETVSFLTKATVFRKESA